MKDLGNYFIVHNIRGHPIQLNDSIEYNNVLLLYELTVQYFSSLLINLYLCSNNLQVHILYFSLLTNWHLLSSLPVNLNNYLNHFIAYKGMICTGINMMTMTWNV